MKPLIFMIAFFALANCGVDGAPVKPTLNAGVSVGTGGLRTTASVGARKGPLSINLDILN